MRTELVTLTASVLINASVLFTLDHATVNFDKAMVAEHQRQMARQGADSLAFEFVEAPPVAQQRHPQHTRKISNLDAVNQDLTRDKDRAETAPHIKTLGIADQLAQKRMNAASSPSPESPSVPPRPPQTESQTPVSKTPPQSLAPTKTAEPEKIEDTALMSPPQPPAQPPSAPSRFRPAVPGLTGHDRITTSEVSRTKSHGAQMYGMTSFEATGSGMGVYIKNMKERIWLAWFPYLTVHYPKDFKTADAYVSFTLDAKGQVRIVKLLDSKGSPLFSAFCMESIQRAGPFGPLPKEIMDLTGKDELEIKFAFHYW